MDKAAMGLSTASSSRASGTWPRRGVARDPPPEAPPRQAHESGRQDVRPRRLVPARVSARLPAAPRHGRPWPAGHRRRPGRHARRHQVVPGPQVRGTRLEGPRRRLAHDVHRQRDVDQGILKKGTAAEQAEAKRTEPVAAIVTGEKLETAEEWLAYIRATNETEAKHVADEDRQRVRPSWTARCRAPASMTTGRPGIVARLTAVISDARGFVVRRSSGPWCRGGGLWAIRAGPGLRHARVVRIPGWSATTS